MAEWLKKYRIRSSSILLFSTWMLYRVAEWGMLFASESGRPGLEVAAILAAVQVPATYYAGQAFKIFQETKTA